MEVYHRLDTLARAGDSSSCSLIRVTQYRSVSYASQLLGFGGAAAVLWMRLNWLWTSRSGKNCAEQVHLPIRISSASESRLSPKRDKTDIVTESKSEEEQYFR